MINAMSDAELSEQRGELLPARTVLSTVRSGGPSSTPGADGESSHGSTTHGATPSFNWMALLPKPDHDLGADAGTTGGQG
jgi:hypothetical protein